MGGRARRECGRSARQMCEAGGARECNVGGDGRHDPWEDEAVEGTARREDEWGSGLGGRVRVRGGRVSGVRRGACLLPRLSSTYGMGSGVQACRGRVRP